MIKHVYTAAAGSRKVAALAGRVARLPEGKPPATTMSLLVRAVSELDFVLQGWSSLKSEVFQIFVFP